MESSNMIKGAICIFVLLNLVGINESRLSGRRGTIKRNPTYISTRGQCLPCGYNGECVPLQRVCNGQCDCSGCQDEIMCGSANSYRNLFAASCSVALSSTTSTIRSTRTVTTNVTSTVTAVKTKTGTAVVNSTYLSSSFLTFMDTSLVTIISLVGENYPAMATVCSVIEAAAVGANRFRIDLTSAVTMSSATFSGTCSATTVFPQH
ncbi:hypothetical protein ACF0H5_023464 [Mactra antiquata]